MLFYCLDDPTNPAPPAKIMNHILAVPPPSYRNVLIRYLQIFLFPPLFSFSPPVIHHKCLVFNEGFF